VAHYPESTRDPLPENESCPVGREMLDRALEDAGVERVDLVYFLRAGTTDWRDSDSGALIDVTFRARGEYSERIELRIHAVPSAQRRQCNAALLDALPHVARWIRNAETGENVWRSRDHALIVRWIGTALQIDES
jgi:hypothetical protein